MKVIPTLPNVNEEVKASCIQKLKEALALAENHEIDNVIIILGRVDGNWIEKVSETVKFSEAIGRLEIIKQEWIAQLIANKK